MILLRKIMKNTSDSKESSAAVGGKRLFTVLRAKLCCDRHVIFTISLREIVKMTCLSQVSFAAEGGVLLATGPQ
jgi:hypothetical protein